MFDTTTPAGDPADTLEASLENSEEARSDGQKNLVNASASLTTTARTRYRDQAMSWLALGAMLASWHMGPRIDRPAEQGSARHATVRSSSPRTASQLWLARAAETRSWIARAPHSVTSTAAEALNGRQPEWPALASVRTVRRWLGSL